jgi:hypothetical protein
MPVNYQMPVDHQVSILGGLAYFSGPTIPSRQGQPPRSSQLATHVVSGVALRTTEASTEPGAIHRSIARARSVFDANRIDYTIILEVEAESEEVDCAVGRGTHFDAGIA